MGTADSIDEIFEASLRCLSQGLRVDRSSILLFDHQSVMRFRAWTGLSDEYLQAVDEHSPWVVDEANPASILVPDVLTDAALEPFLPVLEREGIRALAFIPLTVRGQIIGKFMLYYSDAHSFSEEEVLTAEVLGSHIGLAVDRFRAHQAVAANEHRYRALVEGMGVAAYTTDASGLITYFNEEAATLWGRRPAIGESWCGSWVIYRPDGERLPHDQCPMAVALKEDRAVRNVEIIAERPDGARADVLPFPTPLHDAEGNLIGAVNMMIDITERKRGEADRQALLEGERAARREAEAAVHARDEFLSIASHELRNPVAGIRGGAQLMQRLVRRNPPEPERIEAYADSLVETSGRIARLLDDLLDVARLENGQLRLQKDHFDLLALIRDVIDECRGQGASNHVVVDADDDAWPLVADSVRVRQVLANLLENAIKYSPDHEAIYMTLRRDDAAVTVEVIDHGIGFSRESGEQLFTPFGRAENAREANIPGMGLGLHICRQLAEMHGGTLRAESDGEGLGACFTFLLPLDGVASQPD